MRNNSTAKFYMDFCEHRLNWIKALDDGWHHGNGKRFVYDTISYARSLIKILNKLDIYDINVSPDHLTNNISISFIRDQYFVQIQANPDRTFDISIEDKDFGVDIYEGSDLTSDLYELLKIKMTKKESPK